MPRGLRSFWNPLPLRLMMETPYCNALDVFYGLESRLGRDDHQGFSRRETPVVVGKLKLLPMLDRLSIPRVFHDDVFEISPYVLDERFFKFLFCYGRFKIGSSLCWGP